MSIGKYKGGLKSSFKRLSKDRPMGMDMVNTEDALAEYIYNLIVRLQASLKEKGNDASMTLSQSFDPLPIEFKDNKYLIELKYEGYGPAVDEGRKPEGYSKEKRAKMVPKIYQWIQNKESLHSLAQGKKQQYSLAYAITTKILKKGTKGSKWLTDVIGKDAKKLEAEMSSVISLVLGKDVEVQVTKQAQDMLNGNHG